MKIFGKSLVESFAFLAFASVLLLGFLAEPVQAAKCPRGDLSSRYCDQDKDMVADTPKSRSDWLNPKVLIFAFTPVEDPAVYRNVWKDFLEYLEKKTGKRVRFFPVQSNAAQIEAMRAGRLHVAAFNTGSNPLAVNCAGYVPVAMMAADDNSYGYEMEIITYADSGIKEVKDLKGKKLAFTSPTSNSGYKAPTALLESEFGLKQKEDYEVAFSGKHDNSVLGVANKDYDAAAIANNVMERMFDRKVLEPKRIRTIYKSETFPTASFGYAYNLKPSLAAKIKEAFLTFNWEGTGLAKEYKKEDKFMPITYKEHWDVVRKIDTANGVKYTCR